jgi:hypothetical protein
MLTALVFANNVSACKILETDLVYGRGQTPVGMATITHNWKCLSITFEMDEGWTIDETNVAIGDDLLDIPQNKKGNPKIGKFPYTGQTSYCIPFSELGIGSGDTIIIVIHAVVSGPGAQSETAWADTYGTPFGGSNSAIYLTYTIL